MNAFVANDMGNPAAPAVSFEFFPPKSESMEKSLWQAVTRLAPLAPRFVSVTYGAGGSTRDRTHALVSRICAETALAPAAHLTCVGAARDEVDAVVRRYWAAGVRHIVALRGDPPGDAEGFSPHPEGYASSVELIAALKRLGNFEVSAGAYPEPHPDSQGQDRDMDWLKRKIDAGASRLITQYFFENDYFLRFRDRAVRAGITVPIVPGILPVVNFTQVARFSAACGATVPDWLAHRFDGLEEDAGTRALVAAATAAEQCLELSRHGVDGFHFYSLNKADIVYAICHMLGLRPQPAPAPAQAANG
jgi:methylenetetrahydrofolate reductase (NADPH)